MPRTLALTLVLALAACAAPAPEPPDSPRPTPPATPPTTAPVSPGPTASARGELAEIIGDWVLEEGTLDGEPIPRIPKAPISLNVNAARIGGTSACNSYGADWIVTQDGSVEIDQISMTMMLCEGPINDSEMAYLEALGRTSSVGLQDGRLVLAGEGAELRFVPAED